MNATYSDRLFVFYFYARLLLMPNIVVAMGVVIPPMPLVCSASWGKGFD